MNKFYEVKEFEFDEAKFNESLVLADQNKPTEGAPEKMAWAKAISYVAHAYWAHYQDENKTFYYFKKIYEQGGLINDYPFYGLCYFSGYGVEKNPKKAREILQKVWSDLSGGARVWALHMCVMVEQFTWRQEADEKLEIEVSKNNELTQKYNEKCAAYSALEEKLNQTKNELSKLKKDYERLQDKEDEIHNKYRDLKNERESSSSRSSSSSDEVNVLVSYKAITLFGSTRNTVEMIIPKDEYKSLLKGSMKARIAFVESHVEYNKLLVKGFEDVDISMA